MITRIATWARNLRVPTAEQLKRMSDDEAYTVITCARRARIRVVVMAELERRDLEDQLRAREAARLEKQRAKRAALREAYDLYVHAAWLAAETDCNGYLLSKDGNAAGVDPVALWSMHESRAMRLASEELRDWWRVNGRTTFKQWQKQAREQRPETVAA
jgi:hypothetical protein